MPYMYIRCLKVREYNIFDRSIHEGMRPRKYSSTANVPLLKMAVLGIRNEFPSNCSDLKNHMLATLDTRETTVRLKYLSCVHSPSSGGT